MTTWNEASPPILPPLTATEKLHGTVRLGLFILLTVITLAIFLPGRYLRPVAGRWVTFHFFAAKVWSLMGLRLIGVRRKITGDPAIAGALVANHSSWADILALRSIRLIYFVSKADVAAWPGVGFIARVTGTVFIERKRTEAKRQEQMLRERIAADQLLCFFPEGTSTDGLRVLPFKSSLFSAFFDNDHGADLWVQPVSVFFRPSPESGLPENFFGWWGDMSFEAHIWQVFCRSHNATVTVTFHQAVRPEDLGDRKKLAEYCQRQVAKTLPQQERLAAPV